MANNEFIQAQIHVILTILIDNKMTTVSKFQDNVKQALFVQKGLEKYGPDEFHNMLETAAKYITENAKKNEDLI